MPDKRFVIITGAGASRRLGMAGDLPLMDEWATILRRECNAIHPRLADAIGLGEGLWADQFEEVVGSLFAFSQNAMPLVGRFLHLGGPQPGDRDNHVTAWKSRTEERLGQIVEALRTTLFREFGGKSIDQDKARDAYGWLLEPLGGKLASVVFATTNYDSALEIGLAANGLSTNDGFRSVYSVETPTLAPEGMVNWADRHGEQTPILHLHGAVGWYEAPDGRIVRHYSDQLYNPTLGVPAVLPPDPDKDPLASAQVAAIWSEFERALEGATHVLVLGHSLRDAPLARTILQFAMNAQLGVTRHTSMGGPNEDHEDPEDGLQDNRPDVTQELLERATQIPLDFGPEPTSGPEYAQWTAWQRQTP